MVTLETDILMEATLDRTQGLVRIGFGNRIVHFHEYLAKAMENTVERLIMDRLCYRMSKALPRQYTRNYLLFCSDLRTAMGMGMGMAKLRETSGLNVTSVTNSQVLLHVDGSVAEKTTKFLLKIAGFGSFCWNHSLDILGTVFRPFSEFAIVMLLVAVFSMDCWTILSAS